MKYPQSKQGFTLIELMITVAVVGIITAIALPSYSEYVRRSRRSDARVVLLQSAQFMERFLTENDRYDLRRDGVTPVALPSTISPSGTSGSQVMYNISVSAVTRTSYTLQAVPVVGNAMDGDVCGSYIIDNLGVKSNANNSRTTIDCWSK